jgi:hypothetical protein
MTRTWLGLWRVASWLGRKHLQHRKARSRALLLALCRHLARWRPGTAMRRCGASRVARDGRTTSGPKHVKHLVAPGPRLRRV